ncbi:neprilysin-like [Ornithodoros turicata]|uniref:neprilysin-like n=1 Tax=Ornithodoros turicata TaxID=34597 RepID=UPI003139CDA7
MDDTSVERPAERLSVLKYLAYWGIVSAVLVLIMAILGFISLPSVKWTTVAPRRHSAAKPYRVPRRLRVQQAPTANGSSVHLCGSRACVEQASRLHAELEYSVDPCADFYHFACSRWIQRHEKTSQDQVLSNLYANKLADLLEEEHPEVPEMKYFFGNCVHPEENLFTDVRATFFYLLGFSDWPYLSSAALLVSPEQVSAKIGAVFREMGIESLFRFSVAEDPDKPRLKYLALEEPRLLSLSRDSAWMDTAYKRLMEFYGKFSDTNITKIEQDLISLMERPDLDPLALKRCKTMTLIDFPAIDYLRWGTLFRNAFGTDAIYEQDVVKLACAGYVMNLFNRGALPKVTDLLNYILFRIVVTLSPLMANATLRDATSYAYVPSGATPRHLCVRLLDNYEPAVPMYLAYNDSTKYFGGFRDLEDLAVNHLSGAFEKHVNEVFRTTGEFRVSALKALQGVSWDLFLPGPMEDTTFRKQYLDGLYSNTPMSPLAYFYYFWIKKTVMRRRRSSVGRPREDRLWTGWTGGFLSNFPRLETPYHHLEIPLPVFDFEMSPDSSVRHLHIPRVAPRMYHVLLRFLYHRALNDDHEGDESPAAIFERVRRCVQEQYASIQAATQATLADVLDVIALVPALEAYRSYLPDEVDYRLLTAQDLSSRQLFFIYYASSFCETEDVSRTGTSGRLRVNGPLRNMPEFAEAFKCPPGSFMNPTKVCALAEL